MDDTATSAGFPEYMFCSESVRGRAKLLYRMGGAGSRKMHRDMLLDAQMLDRLADLIGTSTKTLEQQAGKAA